MSAKRVIIDTDGEFDDVLALILALKSPELKIEAITTLSGIRTLDQSTTEVLNILELMGKGNIPVSKGMARSLSRDNEVTYMRIREIWRKGGRKSAESIRQPSIKPVNQDAVSVLTNHIMENPGEITLITLGALTNAAVALLKEPKLPENLKEAYTMGGAVIAPGNITPVAEFNIWGDPLAAKIFFNSGIPITMVGLKTYYQPRISHEQWSQVRNTNRVTEYTFKNFEPWLSYLNALTSNKDGMMIGDALTVGVCVDDSLASTRNIYVDVETRGEITVGQTMGYGLTDRHPSEKEKNTRLCTNVDSEKFIRMFLKRIR